MISGLTAPQHTADGVQRVSVEKAEGSRVSAITPNWCDRCSWYYSADKKVGKALTELTPLTFQDPDGKAWIDNYHGRYSVEDFLTTKDGDVPRLKVYVDSVEMTEQDPHTGTGGDYTVQYDAVGGAIITFAESQAGKAVTVDCWESNGSMWVLKPSAGKKLKIVSVEAQFAEDVSITDSIHFAAYGLVEVFAPHLTPSPYPAGTLIPLGDPVIYKTMLDFINEANGAMPVIPKTIAGVPTWRDLSKNIATYPWQYQAVTELLSSAGMEIRIWLEHETPFDGLVATATFYCLSYDE
ncbi:MAG: hypothetical protein R3212_02720 [Xanthomonadales bacterium]|nr:hypothetical protein [Xanthomonadales bacterium]